LVTSASLFSIRLPQSEGNSFGGLICLPDQRGLLWRVFANWLEVDVLKHAVSDLFKSLLQLPVEVNTEKLVSGSNDRISLGELYGRELHASVVEHVIVRFVSKLSSF